MTDEFSLLSAETRRCHGAIHILRHASLTDDSLTDQLTAGILSHKHLKKFIHSVQSGFNNLLNVELSSSLIGRTFDNS